MPRLSHARMGKNFEVGGGKLGGEQVLKALLLRLAIAAPLTLAALLSPFLLSMWIQDRFGIEVHYLIPLTLGMWLAFTVFFAIVGKQMKQVDEDFRRKRGR